MKARKAGKPARRIALNIGLLCSKTFDDAIFEELFEAKYGLRKADMVKMNIKGVFQIWMRDGSYHEINLKECHAWTREGCKTCPDFAAEHADISTGGIGAFNDWTLTIVRTDLGREIIDQDAGGRLHRGPARRRRPRRHRPAAEAVDRVAASLARHGGALSQAGRAARPRPRRRRHLSRPDGIGPRARRGRPEVRGQPSRRDRTRTKTASSMGSVSLPVKVFCWLGWIRAHDGERPGSGHR